MPLKTYKPYRVVTVPFPFTDRLAKKRRPAVVLSTESFQQEANHCLLAMVTSAKGSHWVGDYAIKDLVAAGLDVPCVVRQKLFTVDSRLIVRECGCLSEKDKAALKKSMKKYTAL